MALYGPFDLLGPFFGIEIFFGVSKYLDFLFVVPSFLSLFAHCSSAWSKPVIAGGLSVIKVSGRLF